MAPPGVESKTLRYLFGEDLDEEVDYKSDRQFGGPNGSSLTTITGEDDNSRAPRSVIECGATDTLKALRTSPDVTSNAEIITNPLDEQQQQQVARENRAKRRSETLVHLVEQMKLSLSCTLRYGAPQRGSWPIPIGIARWVRGHNT